MERQTLTKIPKSPARGSQLHPHPVRSSAAAHPILELQRSIGNSATQRLIRSPYIQTKLQVSTPGDPFEQEADRVADTVMRMAEPEATTENDVPAVQATPLATRITTLVQREPDAPPCPGSCHVHVTHYERAFGDRGAEPLPGTFLERKPVPLSQQELQILYDWIARPKPGTVSRVGPSVAASNELTGGPLKADVAAEYAKHEAELRAKPNNRVQIIRFEVPAESDPDWPKYRASEISADQKKKTFASLGLRPEEKIFPRSVTSKDFSAYIKAQNADATVFGIIVQLPTPPQLRSDVGKIAAAKDLDALSASTRRSFRAPATAEAVVRVVLAMLKPGQSVAVIGGGPAPDLGAVGFVGGAVVELLRERGITVKVFEKGDDLKEVKKYDLVVSAVGTPRVVQKEHLKPEHELVVDTGFIPEKGGKAVGDVEESARSIPRYITAVPGGTGPIEMAVLMERAAKLLGIKARSWQVELRDGKLRAVFIE